MSSKLGDKYSAARHQVSSEIDEAVVPFLAHRSVRRFEPDPIATDLLRSLVIAAQSAATSSNLQMWSVISVTDPGIRAQICEACGNQKQIISAPTFLVFLADLHRMSEYTRAYCVPNSGLHTLEMYTVAVVDASLAAERLVCAAESTGLGICYIGAMRNQPDRIASLLGIPERAFAIFGLCLGYPCKTTKTSIKPRLQLNQIWGENQYPSCLDSSEYDARAAEFFADQGMDTSAPWSEKSAHRVSIAGLGGREYLDHYLQQTMLKPSEI